jgi:hypothetical protein
MADKYWFSSGGFIDIQGISITPNTGAKVQALCFYSDGIVVMKCVSIEGEEYNNWANNDDYLIALVGHKLGFGERVEVHDPYYTPKPITPYTFKTPLQAQPQPSAAAPVADASQVYHDDARSVHNEADIAKITTLEEQMVEQQRMVAQLKSILISKGMI